MLKKRRKVKERNLVILLVSLLLILAIVSVCFIFFTPNVELLGKRVVTIKLNEKYSDNGVKATYQGKDVTDEVKINGKVNSQKIGTYKISYTVKKGLFSTEAKRIVKVIDDIKPEITLEGGNEVSACPGKKYKEQGYKAIDNYDGDITSKVKIEETDKKITYTVSDSSGNKTVVTRTLKRIDDVKPEITLKGDKVLYIEKGGKYIEPGYTASDNCDGDVTSKVEVTEEVNTNEIGTYKINYSVKDTKGNIVSTSRVVYVRHTANSNGIYKNSMIYLTFDDGPSNVTSKILDILKKKNVKATFFVINHSDDLNDLIKREYNEGHTVALHSYTHRYDIIYTSVDKYFNDLDAISKKVQGITGVKPTIIRFPGGGSNTISKNYSHGIMKTLTKEVITKGYHYFDWNVDCGDAGSAKSKEDVYNNVVNHLSHNQTNVVLMHDFQNNDKTVEALNDIIDYGIANGYQFAAIDMDTPMVKHRVNN